MDAKFDIFSLMTGPSGSSMLPPFAILENGCCFSVVSDIWKPPNWIVSGILTEGTEYCFKKIARKTQGSAKKVVNISRYP